MKRIQAPHLNEKSFTVPILTLSSVMIQKLHYVAMLLKAEHSHFIVSVTDKIILYAHTIAL